MTKSPHIRDEPANPADRIVDDEMPKTMRGHPEDRPTPINGLQLGKLVDALKDKLPK
ncbi:MAG: hypothetical protein AAFP13_08815 [Pseudomonadota bacterium]